MTDAPQAFRGYPADIGIVIDHKNVGAAGRLGRPRSFGSGHSDSDRPRQVN